MTFLPTCRLPSGGNCNAVLVRKHQALKIALIRAHKGMPLPAPDIFKEFDKRLACVCVVLDNEQSCGPVHGYASSVQRSCPRRSAWPRSGGPARGPARTSGLPRRIAVM